MAEGVDAKPPTEASDGALHEFLASNCLTVREFQEKKRADRVKAEVMKDLWRQAGDKEREGHTTCVWVSQFPPGMGWCQKEPCEEIANRKWQREEDARQDKLAEELREKGHKCISIQECYPCRVVWCEEETCIKLPLIKGADE